MIKLAAPIIDKEEKKIIKTCLKEKSISSVGRFVKKFEQNFSKYLGGKKYSITTSNGTTAIELALRAYGIKNGDEVIIPDFTFAGTINAVLSISAIPVIVDVDENDWTIDIKEIKKKITKKTKAIIPVHIYGQSAKLNEIFKLARKKKIAVIEDAAEALGGMYKGKKIGEMSECATFSFFANKLITTGEGGMVIFKDKKIALKARAIRNQGRSSTKFYWHNVVGGNFRLSNLQAALGLVQLKKINNFIKIRKKKFNFYNNLFSKDPDFVLLPKNKWSSNSLWAYNILIKNLGEKNRDKLINFLISKKIESRPGFYPLSDMPPYKSYSNTNNKVSKFLSYNSITLPFHNDLTDEQQIYIHKNIVNFKNKL